MSRQLQLPLRTGASASLASIVVLLAMRVFAEVELPVPGVAIASLLIGFAAYLTVRVLTRAKIQDLRRLLRAIETRSFGEVKTIEGPQSNELTELGLLAVRAGTSIQKEIERLRRIESYRRDFIGNVSHELKTPIFAIKGFSETLLGGAIDDEDVNIAFVEKILRNADRLDNLARDLSEISAMETGQLQMERKPFAFVTVVRDVLESLEPKASEKGIKIRCMMSESLPDAVGDAERIRHVLTNLVDNAVKYTNHGGNVEVVVRFSDSAEIKISIVDDGIGIAAEHLPRLTERFYRVDKSRSRSQGGTGLGLSIVKHILAAHDRQLRISSTEGRGSTFGFTLEATPRHRAEVDRHQAAAAVVR